MEEHGLTRRGFLQSIALAGAALGTTPLAAQMQPAPSSAAGRRADLIDVHHHFAPTDYITEIHPLSPLSPPFRAWTVEKTLADMEKTGTSTTILSIPNPGLWFGNREVTRKLARHCNEFGARIVTGDRKRFGAFAAVPLPNADDALQEIEYSLDTLKLDGVGFMSHYGGKYLGDPLFAPVLAELNRRKAIVLVHPIACATCSGVVPGVGDRVIEFGTDTTRTIASLVFSGAATRYPDIRFIFSSAGGTMPSLIERLLEAAKEPATAKNLPNGLIYELQRFYYDTSQSTHPAMLASLAKVVPLSQVVFGTDFPFRTGAEQVASLHKCEMSAAELRGVERENALRLMPRLKA